MNKEIPFSATPNPTILTNDMKFLIKELYEAVFGITETKSQVVEPEPALKPYKGLRQSSISFFNALKKEFRGEEISLSDERLIKLRFEHRITTLSHFLDSLSERGLLGVLDNGEKGKLRRIISFHVNP